MISRTENSKSYFGALILMVLMFLLTCSLPGSSTRHAVVSHPSPTSMEMSTVPVKAISAEAISIPSARNSCLILVSKPIYNLFSNTLKVSKDNLSISKKVVSLEKESLQRRALLLERWTPYHPFSSTTEDPSDLS